MLDVRAHYEQTILFLASVPIFKTRLPKAELPKVAQLLEEQSWKPGARLIRQGDVGKSFYLIYSGNASVVIHTDEGDKETATLSSGDWLGGHTLLSDRPNVASVFAKGPGRLVTLSMTKVAFEASGLKRTLMFPKRPAMHDKTQVEQALGGTPSAMRRCTTPDPSAPLSSAEVQFVTNAIRSNPNLRAVCDKVENSDFVGTPRDRSDLLTDIASTAVLCEIPKGEVVAQAGELGQEFFVISAGSVEVMVGPRPRADTTSGSSAEQVVAFKSVAERFQKKQHFMQQLHKSNAVCTMSVICDGPDKKSPWRAARSFGPKRQGAASKRGVDVQKRFRNIIETQDASSHNGGDKEDVVTTLSIGDSFGELSLLYNTRREATFRASEQSVLYVISRRHFKRFIGERLSQRNFHENCELLDEVDLLTPLLRSERRELACNALDIIRFKPGQRVLHKGKVSGEMHWYIVRSGSAVLMDDSAIVCEMGRGGHFGAGDLGDAEIKKVSEYHVDAGACGMSCVAFDAELVGGLLKGLWTIERSAGSGLSALGRESSQLARNRLISSYTLSSLEEVCLLGRGAFGEVFLVRDANVEGQLFALKRLSKGHIQREEMCEYICWERDLLSMLASPFIINLLGTFKDAQFVYLLLEVALGGDLWEVICKHPDVFHEDEPRGTSTAFYTACVTAALEHLHERRIVYRDLKPENVMLDGKGYGKIVDLGLARFVCGKTSTQVGTPDYMAPEIIDPPHLHDCSADWWSMGVLVFEMLCGQTPFDDEGLDDTDDRLLAIRRSQERAELRFSFTCPMLAKNFTTKLLSKVPYRLGVDRGAKAVREHPFFQNNKFDFEALHNQTLPSPFTSPFKPIDKVKLGHLHSETLPEDESIFVEYLDDGSCKWFDEF